MTVGTAVAETCQMAGPAVGRCAGSRRVGAGIRIIVAAAAGGDIAAADNSVGSTGIGHCVWCSGHRCTVPWLRTVTGWGTTVPRMVPGRNAGTAAANLSNGARLIVRPAVTGITGRERMTNGTGPG